MKNKINTFRLVNSHILYSNQEQILNALQSVRPGITLSIDDNGSILVSDTLEGQSSIQSGKVGFDYLVKLLTTLNESISKNAALKSTGVPALFPRNISLKNVIYQESDGQGFYEYIFNLKLKPSQQEKKTVVLNSEIKAVLTDNGSLKEFYVSTPPIDTVKPIERLSLRTKGERSGKNGGNLRVRIVYHYDPRRQFIIPMYQVSNELDTKHLPASKLFI